MLPYFYEYETFSPMILVTQFSLAILCPRITMYLNSPSMLVAQPFGPILLGIMSLFFAAAAHTWEVWKSIAACVDCLRCCIHCYAMSLTSHVLSWAMTGSDWH